MRSFSKQYTPPYSVVIGILDSIGFIIWTQIYFIALGFMSALDILQYLPYMGVFLVKCDKNLTTIQI